MALHLELDRKGGALPRPAKSARAVWTRRDGLALRLWDDADDRGDGTTALTGRGEASPLPGFSPGGLEVAALELTAAARSPLLAAADDVVDVAGADALASALGVSDPAACFGLSTAILDRAACRQGVPLWRLIAGSAAPTPEPLPLAALVGDDDEADTAVAAGARTLKLKIGEATFAADLARLERLRQRHGASVALRVDANGSLDPARIHERLGALAAVNVALIEEPCPGPWPVPAPLPLAADESLLEAARWPARFAEIHAIVLKPTVLGGFGPCLAWAEAAARDGRAVLVSHTFDGPIALAAACHLALGLAARGVPSLAPGLWPHAGLDAWTECSISALGRATVRPVSTLGLGVT
jgi:L-alanine-DL-glutamate epimerase-like enolase superfamily enzyme